MPHRGAFAHRGTEMATSKAPETIKTVGYIGLGSARYSVASELPEKGFSVVVYGIDADIVRRVAKERDNIAASDGNAELFKDCSSLFIMSKVVREAVLRRRSQKHPDLVSGLVFLACCFR